MLVNAMKKQLFLGLLAMLLLALPAFAQDAVKFKANAIAFRKAGSDGKLQEWGEWQEIEHHFVVIKGRRIEVFGAKVVQEYDVYGEITSEVDNYCIDNEALLMTAVDQDGDRCTLKLRYLKEDDGIQLYVFFNNIQWVYSLVR